MLAGATAVATIDLQLDAPIAAGDVRFDIAVICTVHEPSGEQVEVRATAIVRPAGAR